MLSSVIEEVGDHLAKLVRLPCLPSECLDFFSNSDFWFLIHARAGPGTAADSSSNKFSVTQMGGLY